MRAFMEVPRAIMERAFMERAFLGKKLELEPLSPSTSQARRCLTWVFYRELVWPTRHGPLLKLQTSPKVKDQSEWRVAFFKTSPKILEW